MKKKEKKMRKLYTSEFLHQFLQPGDGIVVGFAVVHGSVPEYRIDHVLTVFHHFPVTEPVPGCRGDLTVMWRQVVEDDDNRGHATWGNEWCLRP